MNATDISQRPHYGITLKESVFKSIDDETIPEQSIVQKYECTIHPICKSGDIGKEIGNCEITYINMPRFFDEKINVSLFDVLENQNCGDLTMILNEDYTDMDSDFRELYPNMHMYDGILVIDSMNVENKFRGKKLSLFVIYDLIARYNFGAAIIVTTVKDPKLKDYYARLGFEQLGDTDMLILCRDCERITPAEFCVSDEDWLKRQKKELETCLRSDNEQYEKAARIRDNIALGRNITKIMLPKMG